MTGRDDILIAILTDRLRLVIQIRDDEQPGMRHELALVERCLLAYESTPRRPTARAVHDLELVA